MQKNKCMLFEGIDSYFPFFHYMPAFSEYDRAERHDFWPQLWLFLSPFSLPSWKNGRRKGERIAKIVINSHAFLLDLRVQSTKILLVTPKCKIIIVLSIYLLFFIAPLSLLICLLTKTELFQLPVFLKMSDTNPTEMCIKSSPSLH